MCFKLWATSKSWKMDSSKISHLNVSPVVKITGYYYVWSERFGNKGFIYGGRKIAF